MTNLRRSARLPLCAAASSLLICGSLLAQTPAPGQLAAGADSANPTPTFSRVAQPGGVALSPDGALVTYTVGGRRGGGLHVVSVADPKGDKVLAPAGAPGCSSGDPAWSPDSQTLAFTSTCLGAVKTEQEQVLLWSRSDGTFKQLTHLKGNIEQLAWSPDGNYIAFLFVENATRSAGALDAMKPWDGVIGEDNIEIQGVYSVSVKQASGVWMVYPDRHQYVYEFAWGPHKEMAVIAADAPGENNWWKAKLYSVEWSRHIDDDGRGSVHDSMNSKLHLVFDPNTTQTSLHGLQIAVPRYSPDGTKIAFIGGLMSDQGSTGGDVWVVDSKGGEPYDITPSIDGTATFEAWTGNDSLGFVEDRSGHTLLTDYTVSSRKQDSSFDLGEVGISGGPIKNAIGVSNRGLLAFVKSGHSEAPELFVMNGATNALTQLTHLNADAKPIGRTESIEWTNGGYHIQGWLTYPVNYDPAKKYPMIVTVHGGPSSSVGSRWGGGQWAALGYFELQPNPRGSYGQGEKFVQANVKDFGYGDLKDILAGVDAVEKKVSIDDHRLGLTGWSYGGFMTMFGVTQTHRFRAAVAGAGISDWQSYYGENSIDQWMIPFFGKSVYDDPAVYAKSSAINYIKNVTTPTLVIVGDRDGECPAPQSFEFWHALRAEGVPTQLVIYPNEGHGFRNPQHIADRAKREAEWFAKYMPEGQ